MTSSSNADRDPSTKTDSTIDEAQRVFNEMSDRAKRDIEADYEQPALRSPLVRTLLLLTILACLTAAATGFYGVYNFPDAPIRQSDSGYVGRLGQSHTKEDFDAFNRWQTVMYIVFPGAFILGFSYAIASAVQRRKQT